MVNEQLRQLMGDTIEDVRIIPAPVTCEGCGKLVRRRDFAINVMMVIGSGGHPQIPPFQCPHEEHWACSPECWRKVALDCLDNHMLSLLSQIHRDIVPTLNPIPWDEDLG